MGNTLLEACRYGRRKIVQPELFSHFSETKGPLRILVAILPYFGFCDVSLFSCLFDVFWILFLFIVDVHHSLQDIRAGVGKRCNICSKGCNIVSAYGMFIFWACSCFAMLPAPDRPPCLLRTPQLTGIWVLFFFIWRVDVWVGGRWNPRTPLMFISNRSMRLDMSSC